MKYALKYFSTTKRMAAADEIIIKYTEPAPLDHLIWFATERCLPNQRLVLDIDAVELLVNAEEKQEERLYETEKCKELAMAEAEKFANVMEDHPNLAIKITPTFGRIVKIFVECIKEFEIPFFYSIQPTCLGEVSALIEQGVSDIYVTEFLAFHMTEIRELAKNTNIRIFPNVAQAPAIYEGFKSTNNDIKKFFIRPEDLEQYEPYADIIEFYGPLDKQDVLMDIYTSGYWMGGLNELIIGFKDEINCMNLMPDFGFYRLDCGHRCDLGKCSYCDISRSLSKELKNKNIYIKKAGTKKRNEYNINEESGFNESAETI